MTRREPSRTVDDERFLVHLGREVRSARGRRGLSRRLLATYAGVSERYLAELEAGRGNVSILLLRQIAGALDLPVESLVATGTADGAEVAALVDRLRGATPEQRRRVHEVLAGGAGTVSRRRRVALIGLRGAGKSTLGRAAAAALGMPFVELNDEIARLGGLSVPEVFDLYGPEGYRRLERRALETVIDRHESVVLATGGGIVSDARTFDTLLAACLTVWLRALPDEHMHRVRAQGDLRPMAGNAEAMEDLELILESREVLYGRADRQLDTSGRSAEAAGAALVALLREEGLGPAQDRRQG